MARKKDKPILGVQATDPEDVKMAFLGMRVRVSQASSRAHRAIRECTRLERHIALLNMEMQLARQSLVMLQKDLDNMLKGFELARAAELRELN